MQALRDVLEIVFWILLQAYRLGAIAIYLGVITMPLWIWFVIF